MVFTLFANQVLSQQAHRSGNFVVSWVTAYSYRYMNAWIRKNWNINRNGFFKVSRFRVFVELSFLWYVVAKLHMFVCKTFAIYLSNFLKIDFTQKKLWAQNNNSKNWLIKLRLDVVRGMVSAFHMCIQSKYPLKLKLIKDETWSAAWSNRFRF